MIFALDIGNTNIVLGIIDTGTVGNCLYFPYLI